MDPPARFISQGNFFGNQVYGSRREYTDIGPVIQPQHIFHKSADRPVASSNDYPVTLLFRRLFSQVRHLLKIFHIQQGNIRVQLLLQQFINFIDTGYHAGKKLLAGISVIQDKNLFKLSYVNLSLWLHYNVPHNLPCHGLLPLQAL